MECRKSSLKFVILRNECYKPFKYTLPNIYISISISMYNIYISLEFMISVLVNRITLGYSRNSSARTDTSCPCLP